MQQMQMMQQMAMMNPMMMQMQQMMNPMMMGGMATPAAKVDDEEEARRHP